MRRRIRLIFVPALVIAASGCATLPPPEQRRPEADSDLLVEDEPETTAEWLFVTSEGKRVHGPRANCKKVAGWLEGEKECAGEACTHARDLGREWLVKCEKHTPDRVPAMQDLVGEYEERADLPPDPCMNKGISLLHTQKCGDPEDCVKQTQAWIARCGSGYATPLFIVMLARTLQRRFQDNPDMAPHEVQFDPRSCDRLADVVGRAVGCDGPEPCRLSFEASEAWMGRCYTKHAKIPIQLAFRIADVRIGAGQGVGAVAVNPLESQLPVGTFPLQLEDNRGVVVGACGKRPKDLNGYLQTRADCSPGEVTIARLDSTNRVRAISVPHENDKEFSRLFPFLLVNGEREARELAAIEVFRSAIAEAVEAASANRPRRAVPLLTHALITWDWTIARQPRYQEILMDSDAALPSAFREWGKLKVKRSLHLRDRSDKAMFAGRAVHSPLHDMAVDGTVAAGTYVAPWPLTISKWMPASFAAYSNAVRQLARTAPRRGLSNGEVTGLRAQVLAEIRACSQAEKRIETANDAVAECMFSDSGCTQRRIRSLASEADPDRERAKRARETIQRILTSQVITNSDVEYLEGERLSSGCLDP